MAVQTTSIYEFAAQALSLTSYTRYENKLLMLIFKYFQQDFKDAITQQTKNHCLTFTPTELSEGVRCRKVPLRCLEPRKGHYARARQALMSMSQKIITIPYYKSNKTMSVVRYPSLFKVNFTMETSKCIVNLRVSIGLLKYYMNLELGFHPLNIDEMLSFDSNATRQLYRLYYAVFRRGRNRLNPEFIGCILSPKAAHTCFASICSTLLEPAKKEMDNAYSLGKCDIHFTYTPYYEPNSVHGSFPDKVIFNFFERNDENPSGYRLQELTVAQKRYLVVLKNGWGVKENVAEDIVKRIQVWMLSELDLLIEKKQKHVDYAKNSKHPIANPAGYIVKNIGAFLDEKEKQMGKMKEKMEKNDPKGTKGELFGSDQ